MSMFDDLVPRPPDGLLGLLAAYRADPRPEKIDLGVGVYKDESGQTPVFGAVRLAESQLAQTTPTKVYESPRGNAAFCAAIARLIFGDAVPAGGRDAFATPGGSGALYLGFKLLQRVSPRGRLIMSNPSWPNHVAMAEAAGLAVSFYRHAQPAARAADVDAVLDALAAAQPGDTILLQGPCHNPTGIDLPAAGWQAIGAAARARGVMPFIDIAYHGLARSIDEDMGGVRALLAEVPDALIAYSCSKNFGLYRDRCGALIVQTPTHASAEAAGSHLADIARTSYSMPPAHGAAVVATILDDPALTAAWTRELEGMRARIVSLRAALATALHPRSNDFDPDLLRHQAGMFSTVPLAAGAADALRAQAVYVPASGRINIAGLSTSVIAPAAAALSAFL